MGLTFHFFHRTRTCTLLHLALTVGFHFCLELGTIFEQLTSLPGCQWTRASWPPLSWRVSLSSGYPCWGWTNKTDALGPPSWNLHLMLAKFQRINTQWTSTMIKSILNSCSKFKPSKPFVMSAQKICTHLWNRFLHACSQHPWFPQSPGTAGFHISRLEAGCIRSIQNFSQTQACLCRRRTYGEEKAGWFTYSNLNVHYYCFDLRGAINIFTVSQNLRKPELYFCPAWNYDVFDEREPPRQPTY